MRIESLEQSDVDLVEAAQHGRLESFGALYQRYHNPMVALAYAQLGDKHTAEDAAQEVFAIACRDLGSLQDRAKFAAWLGGICRNVCRQMLRGKTQAAPPPGSPATVARASRPCVARPSWPRSARSENRGRQESKGKMPSSQDAEPLDHMEQQKRWDAVRRAVWQLPAEERELVVMRYIDGFSQARISQVLDVTPAAVNGRLTRAKRKIAELLEQSGFGSDSWDA